MAEELKQTVITKVRPQAWRSHARTRAQEIISWFRVEHHGKYSIERLVGLYEYSTARASSSADTQYWLLLMSTPLPSLLLNGLIDVIPLTAPNDRGASHHVFWARLFLVSLCISGILFDHFRTFIPELAVKMKTRRVWLISFVVSGVVVLYDVAMSCTIGFPLPFVLLFSSPVFILVFGIGMLSFIVRELSKNHALRVQMKHTYGIFAIQFSLMIIYPLYNYAFRHTTGAPQTAMALLLPLMKMTARSVFSCALKFQNEDMRPEVVVFNAEVFHTLFNAFCLQSSTSTTTSVVLTCVDVLETLVGVLSVDPLVSDLRKIDAKIDAQRPVVFKSTAAANRIPHIERTLQFVIELESHRAANSSQQRRLVRLVSRRSSLTKVTPSQTAKIHPGSKLFPIEKALSYSPQPMLRTSRAAKQRYRARLDTAEVALLARLRAIVAQSDTCNKHIDESTSTRSMLTLREKSSYVKGTLQLFHVADFILLTGFAEVVVAVIYAGYLAVAYYLPNRAYYKHINTMTEGQLVGNVGSVLLYALVDLLSFAFVSIRLNHKLGISPLHQLAFVVRKQWMFIQSRFLLGLLFTMSSTLEHFGFDYSFEFAWLKQDHHSI